MKTKIYFMELLCSVLDKDKKPIEYYTESLLLEVTPKGKHIVKSIDCDDKEVFKSKDEFVNSYASKESFDDYVKLTLLATI